MYWVIFPHAPYRKAKSVFDAELQKSLEWLLTEAPLTNTRYVVQMRAYPGATDVLVAELDLLAIDGPDPSEAVASDHTIVRWVNQDTGKRGFGFAMYVATTDENPQMIGQLLGEIFSNSYAKRASPFVIGLSAESVAKRFSSDEKKAMVRQLVSSLS